MTKPASKHGKDRAIGTSQHRGSEDACIVQEHFARSVAATMEFFAVEAPAVAECCRRMAERFTAGASLFVMGEGPHASDAQHVAVEFVHPIIVGKRALPAIALTSDIGVSRAPATSSRASRSPCRFARLENREISRWVSAELVSNHRFAVRLPTHASVDC